jgi:hypothetical protein
MQNRPLPPPIRVLLAPLWAVVALKQNRNAHPVPWLYLAAAVIGAGIGFIFQISLGSPWWLGPPIAVAAIWLVFLASARHNLGNVGRSFIGLTAPRAAARWSQRAFEDAFRTTLLPLYGFPQDWIGPRFLGGYQGDGQRATGLTLAHGDPYDEQGQELRVETSVRPDEPLELMKRDMFEGLVMTERRPPSDLSPDEFSNWVRRMNREVHDMPDPEWISVTIPVDAQRLEFELLRGGRRWVAWATFGEVLLTISGRAIQPDEVELVRISDVEPYIEGGRRIRARP